MRSMTGFGEGSVPLGDGHVRISISAVNHRQASISLRAQLDPAVEDKLRSLLRDRAHRGSLSVQVQLPQGSSGINQAALERSWRELNALAQQLGAPPPRIEALLGRATSSAESATHDDAVATAVLAAATAACDALDAARQREGAALQASFAEQLTALRELHEEMSARAPQRLEDHRHRLRERLRDAGATPSMLGDESLARELLLAAERLDVSEELTRLAAHITSGEQLISASDAQPQGRSIEFLVQELHREANTLGAKANDLIMSRLSMQARQIVEGMREQAANVL